MDFPLTKLLVDDFAGEDGDFDLDLDWPTESNK